MLNLQSFALFKSAQTSFVVIEHAMGGGRPASPALFVRLVTRKERGMPVTLSDIAREAKKWGELVSQLGLKVD